MFNFLRPLLAAAALLPVLAFSSSAEILGNNKFPVKTMLVTGCGNVADPIDVQGMIHFVYSSQTNDNRTSLVFQAQFSLDGTDTLGNQYNVRDNTHSITNVSNDTLNQAFTITHNFFLRAIGKGGAPNFQLMLKQHVTVNPNGTVTASFSDFSATCR